MFRRMGFHILIVLIAVLVLTSGCSALPFMEDSEPIVSNLSAESILINSDQIRPQTIKLIENAEKSIFIQLSVLNDPQIINLLIKKSQEGVTVRILLDQWQRENKKTVSTLKNNNISVQYYPAQKGQYHRVSYMVVDFSRAMFYGQDWTEEGFKAYSIAVYLDGDTAWKITRSFEKDWIYTTTLAPELPETVELPEENIVFALNAKVRSQIINSLESSENEIKIIVEQFSDSETIDALIAAKTRGVNIKLILDPSTLESTPNTIKKLKETGVDLRYYSHPKDIPLGFNLGIFDDKTVIITSSSWTYYSFVINHESSLTIPSPEVVQKLDSIFSQEWERATE